MTEKIGDYLPGPNDTPENGIYTGDSRELSLNIPDNSIDIIVTDPLYHEQHMHYYGWLVETAARVLKPGSYLFAYGGWLAKEIYDLMYGKGLDYFMTIALVHNSGHPRWWNKQLFIGFKPVYVFTKGKPTIMKWQSNLAYSDKQDKEFHEYGQGVSLVLQKIDMFTKVGDVVFDPFCGGGQVPVASIATGRRYLAFDIDESIAQIARNRTRSMQKPIFIPEPTQLSFGWRESETNNGDRSPDYDDIFGEVS